MPNTPPKETLAAPAPAPSSAWIPVPGGKGDQEEPFPYFLKIGEVFDGPFDVLLPLIRKQNLDIYDLPIAQITKQFQGYVKHLRREEVDTAGEFVHMASQLIFIKSCLLLPCPSFGISPVEKRLCDWCATFAGNAGLPLLVA